MYIGSYDQKTAAQDLSTVLRTLVQPAGMPLPIDELEGARRRLETLTPAEMLDLVLFHKKSGIEVLRRVPDRPVTAPAKPQSEGRFGGGFR